ncbi:MAG: tetratricopeptide repeat protein [Phycisphaeraceae bacterium]
MSISAHDFLHVVRLPLEQGNASELAAAVLERWEPRALCGLLSSRDTDVRRAAALVIGLIGERSLAMCLAKLLHDRDAQTRQMAEHGLWAIWFRSSSDDAAEPFQQGVDALAEQRYTDAIAHFHEAIDLDPDFAEAHHQCAIAHMLQGDWSAGRAACRRALQHMPCHFAAAAALGHCHTHLENLDAALTCYRRALAIHPGMPGVTRAVEQLALQAAEASPAPAFQAHKSKRSIFPAG